MSLNLLNPKAILKEEETSFSPQIKLTFDYPVQLHDFPCSTAKFSTPVLFVCLVGWLFLFFFSFAVLGTEPRPSHVLSKCSTTELHPRPVTHC